MSDPTSLAQKYLDALSAHDAAALEALFDEQIMLRHWGTQGLDRFRGAGFVLDVYKQEWAGWHNPKFVTLSQTVSENRAALEYRVQVVENARLVEYNRAEFLQLAGEKITAIDSYFPAPIPSGPRDDTAVLQVDESNIDAMLESLRYSFDVRDWMPPDTLGRLSLRSGFFAGKQTHPASNFFFNARWTEQDADAEIEKAIESFRQREAGFCWFVSPLDTPADLGERLLKHGLVFAGTAATMVRIGLGELENIPTNPNLEVVQVPPDRMDLFDQAAAVGVEGFHLPQERLDQMRQSWLDLAANPAMAERERTYLARLDGKPVGYAALQLQGGHAYLNGAATLPEYRGQKIYSTLLRKRLEDTRAFGYHLATIDAEPMSRRVVTRFGFKEYGKVLIYVWMPVIDMEVIRQIVPDE